jgi:hypothetical protein
MHQILQCRTLFRPNPKEEEEEQEEEEEEEGVLQWVQPFASFSTALIVQLSSSTVTNIPESNLATN